LLILGQKNAVNNPLMKPENDYLPSVHIKLGLIKIFVKAMYQNRADLRIWKISFPG